MSNFQSFSFVASVIASRVVQHVLTPVSGRMMSDPLATLPARLPQEMRRLKLKVSLQALDPIGF